MKNSISLRITTFIGANVALLFLGLAATVAHAQERVLDDEAWRADIMAVADAIHEFHPRPFRAVKWNFCVTEHLSSFHFSPLWLCVFIYIINSS